MKACKFFFVLLAGLSLVVASCEKGTSGDDSSTGSVKYNGKRIAMNAPIFEEVPFDNRAMGGRWNNPADGPEEQEVKHYIVGVSSHAGDKTDLSKVTSFYIRTTLPGEDFEFGLSESSYSEHCSRVYFFTNDKLYLTPLIFSVPESRGISSSSIWSIRSLGIDPATGKEIFVDVPPGVSGDSSFEIPEMVTITGGKVKVKWVAEKLRLEFDLKFADGKTATGYGEIPIAVVEK